MLQLTKAILGKQTACVVLFHVDRYYMNLWGCDGVLGMNAFIPLAEAKMRGCSGAVQRLWVKGGLEMKKEGV